MRSEGDIFKPYTEALKVDESSGNCMKGDSSVQSTPGRYRTMFDGCVVEGGGRVDG